jgi:hypothetical protein
MKTARETMAIPAPPPIIGQREILQGFKLTTGLI